MSEVDVAHVKSTTASGGDYASARVVPFGVTGMRFDGPLEGQQVSVRPARTEVTYDVWVSTDTGDFEAQLVNLSAMGFRLRSEADVQVGWNVCLKVAKLPPVEAVVRWVRGDECGGVFLDSVTL